MSMTFVLIVSLLLGLEEELSTLREVALDIVEDMNPRGLLLEDRMWSVPARIRSVATHGIHHGASTTLATAQFHFGHDLHCLEPGFPVDAGTRV